MSVQTLATPASVLLALSLVVLTKVPMYLGPAMLWAFLKHGLVYYYPAFKAKLGLP